MTQKLKKILLDQNIKSLTICHLNKLCYSHKNNNKFKSKIVHWKIKNIGFLELLKDFYIYDSPYLYFKKKFSQYFREIRKKHEIDFFINYSFSKITVNKIFSMRLQVTRLSYFL